MLAAVLALVAFIVGAVLAAIERNRAMVAVAVGLVALTWLIHPLT